VDELHKRLFFSNLAAFLEIFRELVKFSIGKFWLRGWVLLCSSLVCS